MGAKRTKVHRLQELIRLHRMGRSQREISDQLRMYRPTIRKYAQALEEAGILQGDTSEQPDPVELQAVVEKHAPKRTAARQPSSMDAWELAIKGGGPGPEPPRRGNPPRTSTTTRTKTCQD